MNSVTRQALLMPIPSLRLSGGTKEALRLAEELKAAGVDIRIITLWRSSYELDSPNVPVVHLSSFLTDRSKAMMQYPLLLFRFLFYVLVRARKTRGGPNALLLTHFSTFPLAWLTPHLTWYCFNQDIEWMFVKAGLRRVFLRWFILATSRRSRVITTNAFVESLYRQEGIQPIGRLSIWASMKWLNSQQPISRDIDVVMLLRRGHMKRLDLYAEILDRISKEGFTSCVITPDSDIFEEFVDRGTQRVLLPSDEALKDIYGRSKVFLLLSDTEGFGLPPLEAMGSGCVPLCRDSGGPRCYMNGLLAANLIPLDASSTEVFAILKQLLAQPDELQALSEFAVGAFSKGYASSMVERGECVEILNEILRAGN